LPFQNKQVFVLRKTTPLHAKLKWMTICSEILECCNQDRSHEWWDTFIFEEVKVKNISSGKQFEWLTKKNDFLLFGKQQQILQIYIHIFHLQVMQYDGNTNIYIFHFQLIVLSHLTLVTVVCT